MNDFQIIAFRKQRPVVVVTRNDFAIALYHHPRGANLQLFQEAGQTEPIGYFLFFAVDPQLHLNKNEKTAFTSATL